MLCFDLISLTSICDFYRHVPSGAPARVASLTDDDGQIKLRSLVLSPSGQALAKCYWSPHDQLLKIDAWSPLDLQRIASASEPGVFVDPLGIMSAAWSQLPSAESPLAMPELL